MDVAYLAKNVEPRNPSSSPPQQQNIRVDSCGVFDRTRASSMTLATPEPSSFAPGMAFKVSYVPTGPTEGVILEVVTSP